MERRHILVAAAGTLVLPRAYAHHGWSSFDQGRPVYLEGVARKVVWRNPHVEFDLEVPAEIKVPPDLAKRPVPAQSASVDGAGLFARAEPPRRKDKVWHIECAPLTRMEAWKVPEVKNGDKVAMVGFTFGEEKGDPILRVEYLLLGDRTYGLRSSPA